MKNPRPSSMDYPSLINDIERGLIKIPQFQRDFVWDLKKSAELIDSIVKSYPIGTFIFWKTKERLRSLRNIGNLNLPESPDGDFVELVLDGQQRITSLFATLKGVQVEREGNKIDDFNEIYLDLGAKEDERIVVLDTTNKNPLDIIKLKTLLYGTLTELNQYPKKHHALISEYKTRIESYNFPVILIEDKSIDVATEIFTRINVSGKDLTLFQIMVAKTFEHTHLFTSEATQDAFMKQIAVKALPEPTKDDMKAIMALAEKKSLDLKLDGKDYSVEMKDGKMSLFKVFDLSEKFDKLLDELRPVNYETISDASILQTIALVLKKECKRRVILKLEKKSFIDTWNKTIDAIKSTVDYFRSYYRIPVSHLLPYNALIVPFAYYFYFHPDKPTGDEQKYLEDFFWRCALSTRYSSSVDARLSQDVKRIDEILAGKLPSYDWGIDTSPTFINQNGWFSVGRSYVKAILCVYAYHQPKSFIDDSLVNINNDWLKQANSRNYHHFFPKAYLKTVGVSEDDANHVLNITIVDDYLNKRKIGAKAPAVYMDDFKKKNPKLNDTMKTHLITDLDKFGVWENDYQKFLQERAVEVSKELEKRLIKQDIDKQPQPISTDDYEDTEME